MNGPVAAPISATTPPTMTATWNPDMKAAWLAVAMA
jgi:hypothetical protein